MYGEGISKTGDILDIASDLDIVKRSGVWYSYGDHKLGQGRENAKQFFKENPEICLEIENKIRKHYDLPLAAGVLHKQEQAKDTDNKDAQTADAAEIADIKE